MKRSKSRYPEYNEITPEFKFLSDKAIMIQAWKKAHEFIRRHNWFCDSLDLDLSCIQLDDLCSKWCEIFTKQDYRSYTPDSMRLVPAPKPSENWTVEKDGLLKHKGNIPCRPLAHLSIKDQTLGVVFLICLANIIETEQGRLWTPKVALDEIKAFPGVNYGNRLLCVWEDNNHSIDHNKSQAFFQWANVETYRKYYDDYQAFIKRPAILIRKLRKNAKSIAVVSMDLSKCYDRIIRKELLEKINKLVSKYNKYDKKFLDCIKRYINWSWDDDIEKVVDIESGVDLKNNGIPQGLVASGFFANIYLIEFDMAIKQLIDIKLDILDITIKDYCRYVDDMRFVVELPYDINETKVKTILTEFIQQKLNKTAEGQIVNEKKTDVCIIDPNMEINLIEERIGEIKKKTSGPIDDLEGMDILTLTRLVWNESGNKFLDDNNFINTDESLKSLRIPKKIIDVKPESVERFAAYTWRKVYRTLCLLICDNDDTTIYSSPLSRLRLDALTDDFCKQVVIRWLKEPSKVRIIRVAFDLFPHPKYLEIILKVLLDFIKSTNKAKQHYGSYILSELYRSAAVETGHVRYDEQLPSKANITGYRLLLFDKAEDILSSSLDVPWYLANQMILFLVLMKNTTRTVGGKILKAKAQYKYRRLYELVHAPKRYARYKVEDFYLIILAYKFTRDEDILLIHLPAFLNKNNDRFIRLLELLPEERKLIEKNFCSSQLKEKYLLDYYCHQELNQCCKDKRWRNLYTVIKAKNKPLANEVAILRLAEALFRLVKENPDYFENNYLSPANIQIKCNNYSLLINPIKSVRSVAIELKISCRQDIIMDRRFQPEPWENDKKKSIITQIGRILRSAMIGQTEYSIMSNHKLTEKNNDGKFLRYWGIRSSWIKRKYGLYFDRTATGGVHVPNTPWLNNMLSFILSWPGSWIADEFTGLSYQELIKLIKKRLNEHKTVYGRASKTLIFPVPIDLNKFSENDTFSDFDLLNIAIVQTAYPQISMFDNDLKMTKAENRQKQRLHLADMLQMLAKTFKTHKVLDSRLSCLNLIIFPELSIHIDDCYKLEQFAGEMNCMIFCGQVYHDHPEDDNKIVNTGLWLIPQYRDKNEGQSFVRLSQGKCHLTSKEVALGISSYRPVQWLIQGYTNNLHGKKIYHWGLSASICYDATDIKLAADLRDYVDCYIISAANKDIPTFDNMIQSLRYHMFNHTVIVNSGEFGGSAVQAPYKDSWERVLLHNHGKNQATVTVRTLNLKDFENNKNPLTKTSPAGYTERKY